MLGRKTYTFERLYIAGFQESVYNITTRHQFQTESACLSIQRLPWPFRTSIISVRVCECDKTMTTATTTTTTRATSKRNKLVKLRIYIKELFYDLTNRIYTGGILFCEVQMKLSKKLGLQMYEMSRKNKDF